MGPSGHFHTEIRIAGFAYMVLAVFCAVVAAVPWANKVPFDFVMWLFFAAVLLVIGAWQIDKAGKEDSASERSRPGR